jgi:hypothetical protein
MFRNRDRMTKIFVWVVVLAMVIGIAATIGTAFLS